MKSVCTFGEWLKLRRKVLGLTQKQLALQVGYSTATIKKIEGDARRPSRQVARSLAQQLSLQHEHQALFTRVARGELPVQRLPAPHLPVAEQENGFETYPPAARLRTEPPLLRITFPGRELTGRERELVEISQLLLAKDCRLLTISGMGGVGKSYLARAAAYTTQENFPGGACFISLIDVDSPAFLLSAIAGAVKISFHRQGEAKKQLFQFLSEKPRLLVLDGFDPSLEGADLIGELLGAAPQARLLVTSREPLHLREEWIYVLRGLPVPGAGADGEVETVGAVQLFLQTARRHQVSFQATPADLQAIVRICQAVGGLPLAILLAAHWTRTLSCGEIAEEVDRSLDILSSQSREISPHHRSLRSICDGYWKRLNAGEQDVLERLAALPAGFGRQAALEAAGATLAVLATLIDLALVWRTAENEYQLDPLFRQYLHERSRVTVFQER